MAKETVNDRNLREHYGSCASNEITVLAENALAAIETDLFDQKTAACRGALMLILQLNDVIFESFIQTAEDREAIEAVRKKLLGA